MVTQRSTMLLPRLRRTLFQQITLPQLSAVLVKQVAQLRGDTLVGLRPGGIGLIINCLTDNRNRAAADVRSHTA